jgi:hypothetical protein
MHPHRSESETRVSSGDGLRDQGRTDDRGQPSRHSVRFDQRSQVGWFENWQDSYLEILRTCLWADPSGADAPQKTGDEHAELRRYPHFDGNFSLFGVTDETTALRPGGQIFGHGISPAPRPEPTAAQLLPDFYR